MCTRTLFGKAEIMLWRIDAEVFRIEVARSSARYVWDLLEEALSRIPRLLLPRASLAVKRRQRRKRWISKARSR